MNKFGVLLQNYPSYLMGINRCHFS